MKTFKQYSNTALFSALFMMTFFMGGCGGSSSCEDTTRPAIVVEDTTPPYIMSTVPANGDINVPLATKISATFNEEINPDTVVDGQTFTVVDANGEPILGTVSYGNNNTVMIFTPEIALDYNTTYTATITTDVTDMDGNALDITNGLNVWSFTTINEADVVPPTVNTPPIVISTIPVDGAINVPLNRTVSALLSKTLDGATVNDTTFTLHNDTSNSDVNGSVSYNLDRTVYFDPIDDLNQSTQYTATITTGVTDTNGLNLDDSNGLNVWTFTTGTTVAQGPDPVNLGTAGNFAILTKAGITDVPNSAITGNIGTSPITAAAIEVTCAEMTIGSIYGVDAAYVGSGDVTCYKGTSTDKTLVDNAVLDMVTAYNDAAGRTPAVGANLNIGAGSLDSTTPDFAPGLYTWGTDVTITDSITLTGNADDTWIFQISGNLILASGAPGAQIILGPNVQAKNVVWQVAGTNVTIGTGAQFSGVVLAKELIAVQTGASVEGRLLAQTEVTLDQNVITQPTP